MMIRERLSARSRQGRRFLGMLRLGLAGGVALSLACEGRGQSSAVSEYEVKAAWLLDFARFVEWPSNAWANATDPLVVGVVGRDPFGKGLEEAFLGKTIRGRPVLLLRKVTDSEARRCHIVFFSASERRHTRRLLEQIRGRPVLTVSEADNFLDQGGVINFLLKDGAVRFEVNVRAAQRSGLTLDANLLKVAVFVRGRYD